MTPNHTPTPWKAEWDEERETWRIWQRDGDFKDREWNMTPYTIRTQADVDFIVRAVNAHEELLEAAKACVEMFDGLQPSDMAPLVNRSAYNRCLRAIAAASERSEKAEGRP